MSRANISKSYRRVIEDNPNRQTFTIPALRQLIYRQGDEVRSHEAMRYCHLEAILYAGTLMSPLIDVPDISFISGAVCHIPTKETERSDAQ